MKKKRNNSGLRFTNDSLKRISFSKFKNVLNLDYEEKIQNLVAYINHNLDEFHPEEEKTQNSKSQNDKNSLSINMFDIDIIIYIMNKVKKTPNDILIMKTYLSAMNFFQTIKTSINNEQLLFSLCSFLKIEEKPKNSIIFKYGNIGGKFYIVLKGEVSILILKETNVEICLKRYFIHLMVLKMMKEDELLNKTFNENFKMNSFFDEKDFNKYYNNIKSIVEQIFGKSVKLKEINSVLEEVKIDENLINY